MGSRDGKRERELGVALGFYRRCPKQNRTSYTDLTEATAARTSRARARVFVFFFFFVLSVAYIFRDTL